MEIKSTLSKAAFHYRQLLVSMKAFNCSYKTDNGYAHIACGFIIFRCVLSDIFGA